MVCLGGSKQFQRQMMTRSQVACSPISWVLASFAISLSMGIIHHWGVLHLSGASNRSLVGNGRFGSGRSQFSMSGIAAILTAADGKDHPPSGLSPITASHDSGFLTLVGMKAMRAMVSGCLPP